VGELGVPPELGFRFLKLGVAGIENIDAICKKHNMPAPTELKLSYDLTTGKFNADYKYKPVCSENPNLFQDDVFEAWMEEVQKSTKR
jgi:hypothetical protein